MPHAPRRSGRAQIPFHRPFRRGRPSIRPPIPLKSPPRLGPRDARPRSCFRCPSGSPPCEWNTPRRSMLSRRFLRCPPRKNRIVLYGGPCLSCSMPRCLSYSLASIKPPLRGLASPLGRASPHAAAFPFCAALLSPCAAPPLAPDLPFPLPPRLPQAPLARRCRAVIFPPYARRCRAATLDPRSASLRSGLAAPASATAPPLARRGAACAGGWPFLAPPSRLRRPRLGSGWNSLAGARSPPPRALPSA